VGERKRSQRLWERDEFGRFDLVLNSSVAGAGGIGFEVWSILLSPAQVRCKVEAPTTDRGPIADFIFKSHTFLSHVSMNAIDN
jgi:hypothetical protein